MLAEAPVSRWLTSACRLAGFPGHQESLIDKDQGQQGSSVANTICRVCSPNGSVVSMT